MDNVDRSVLANLENLFSANEVQTLTFRADAGQASQDVAVKVIDNPTCTEVVCNDFPSQIKNKSIACLFKPRWGGSLYSYSNRVVTLGRCRTSRESTV